LNTNEGLREHVDELLGISARYIRALEGVEGLAVPVGCLLRRPWMRGLDLLRHVTETRVERDQLGDSSGDRGRSSRRTVAVVEHALPIVVIDVFAVLWIGRDPDPNLPREAHEFVLACRRKQKHPSRFD